MAATRAGLKGLAWLTAGVFLAGGCIPTRTPSTVPPSSSTAPARLETPSPLPLTPTLPALSACPIPAGSPEPADLSDPAGTQASILNFLNAGGTILGLAEQIQGSGRASGQGQATYLLDLNGDGWDDLVIALTGPPGPEAARRAGRALYLPLRQSAGSGTVLVFLCQDDRYVPGTPAPLEEANAAPILHADAELTGDSSADLLLGWRTCGAHTCLERFEVLSASGVQVLRRALDPSADLPYPEVTITPDGSVGITATGIGSTGAGPFRAFTRTWEWDAASQAFRLTSEELEPPRYRIHVLLDADAAARVGNLQGAMDLYHRVVLDNSLLDWADPEAERANLTGYSMFRVVLTYLQMHDVGDAQKAYGILQNQYPSGSVGRAYAELAQAFWDAYESTGDLGQACQAARDFAERRVEEVITPLYFGYANPTHTPEDICPSEAL